MQENKPLKQRNIHSEDEDLLRSLLGDRKEDELWNIRLSRITLTSSFCLG